MKTKVIILLAVIFILIGLYGLSVSLSKPSGNTVQKVAKPKILVWRLKEDVEPGKIINHRMLAVERLSEAEANQLGFTKDVNLDWQQGAVFRNKLIKGSYLSKHDLIQPNQSGYVEYVISENRIPYPIKVDQDSVLGGVINHGTLIDVLAMVGANKSMPSDLRNRSVKRPIYIKPVITGVKVLQIRSPKADSQTKPIFEKSSKEKVTLILELTRKEAVTLTVAENIADIEVHKSIGKYDTSDLQADSGDILQGFKSVTEYRATETLIR